MAVQEDQTIREPRNGRIRGGHERYGGREADEREKREEDMVHGEGQWRSLALRGDDGSLEPCGGRASKRPRGGTHESRHWLTICPERTRKMPNNDRKARKMEENDMKKHFCAKCQDVEKTAQNLCKLHMVVA